jgi:hypothetical protein
MEVKAVNNHLSYFLCTFVYHNIGEPSSIESNAGNQTSNTSTNDDYLEVRNVSFQIVLRACCYLAIPIFPNTPSRLLTADVDLAGISYCGSIPALAKVQLKSGKKRQNHSSISYFGETIQIDGHAEYYRLSVGPVTVLGLASNGELLLKLLWQKGITESPGYGSPVNPVQLSAFSETERIGPSLFRYSRYCGRG